MDFMQVLAGLLNPNGVWNNGGPQNQLAAAGGPIVGDRGSLYGGIPGVAAPQSQPAPAVASPQPVASPPPAPAAPIPAVSPQGDGGIGGFLSGLFQNPQQKARNQTVQWLVQQGEDPGRASLIAANPATLQRYLLDKTSPAEPSAFDQRAAAAQRYGLDNDDETRRFILTGNLGGGGDSVMSVGKDSYVYDKKAGRFIAPPAHDSNYHVLTPQEVEQAGLPPGTYQRSPEGKIDAVVTPRSQDADFGRYQDVRKEIQQLPSYKNFAQAAPIYDTMVDAYGRDSKASDLNLVYGLGKIMDPGSVVREGEMVMVKDTASLPDWFIGTINGLNGGARLTPETRQAILKEARSRLDAYKGILDSDMGQYKGLADYFKLDQKYLIPPVPNIRDLPAAPSPNTTKTGVPWKVEP